jgi:hypothetical protein
MTSDEPCQSSHAGKEQGLQFLQCDIIEETYQPLEEGICVIKLFISQIVFRMSEKPEIAGLRSGEYGGCGSLVIFMFRMSIEILSSL